MRIYKLMKVLTVKRKDKRQVLSFKAYLMFPLLDISLEYMMVWRYVC